VHRAWLSRDPTSAARRAGAPVGRLEVASDPARSGSIGRHVIEGLNPARLPVGARATALADIGAAAGNGAVVELVSRARTDFPLDPPQGVREIRRIGGGGQLGHCRTFMPADPPLFRLGNPETVEGGVGIRPRRTRAPEFDFHVRYPMPGRHLLYESRTAEGAEANIWLEVSSDWSNRLKGGEEEHVEDQSIARTDTWGRVTEAANRLADGPPIVAPSPDEARRAAWTRFVASLPPLLRPDGAEPTEEAQLAKWGPEVRTSVFRQLVGESKRARDDSQWHTPSADLDHMEGAAEIRVVGDGSSRIPGPRPPELMQAAWDRLASAAGSPRGSGEERGGGGGRR
jgi:hypothetical protein